MDTPKVTHVVEYVHKVSAGYRLNSALNKNAIISNVCVKESSGIETSLFKKKTRFNRYLDIIKNIYSKLLLKNYHKRIVNLPSNYNIFSIKLEKYINKNTSNIIHLHWMAGGMLDLKSFNNKGKGLVWTFHGVWPITGGCHINYACNKWERGCGNCPQLNSQKQRDLSSFCLKKKYKLIKKVNNLTIITPSNWLGDMVKRSYLYNGRNIKVIPNCIDTNLFKPIEKCKVRTLFNISTTSKVVLFVANSVEIEYKGFDLLVEALLKLNTIHNDLVLLVVGSSNTLLDNLNLSFQIKYLHTLNDEFSLVAAYNSANVFVGPSRQDNLPNTFVEATSCGIPCVGFSIGGIPEIVEHKKNGYIAKPFDTEELAYGITWVLEDEDRYKELCEFAREKAVNTYSFDIVAKKHIELYRSILKKGNN